LDVVVVVALVSIVSWHRGISKEGTKTKKETGGRTFQPDNTMSGCMGFVITDRFEVMRSRARMK
jgi:hypothetical protein